MGKVTILLQRLSVGAISVFLFGCTAEYSCPPELIGEEKGIFKSSGSDTLSLNQSKSYRLAFRNPELSGRSLVYTRLQYAPLLALRIFAISDTLVPWPYPPGAVDQAGFSYPAYRPFFVSGVPGKVKYAYDYLIEIDGILTADSIIYEFRLEARQKGVFRLNWYSLTWNSNYGSVSVDSRTQRCDYYWKLYPQFEGGQDILPFVNAFPGLKPGDMEQNRFICVTD
jgi:hypothetical protein